MGLNASIHCLSWSQIRDEFTMANPELGAIIDNINPDDSFRLYKATYNYGDEIIKQGTLQIPDKKGRLIPLTDPHLDPQYQQDLNYNHNTCPVSMLLTNCAEIYLSNGHHTLSLYGAITAGRILNSWVMLNKDIQTHTPPFMWDMSAGARSIFLLSKISNQQGYARLRKTFALNAEKPKRLVDQWKVFREIAQHKSVSNPWLTDIVLFSKKWFKHIDDPSFNDLQKYFYKTAWQSSDYLRNQFIWNYIYSIIEKEQNIKMDAYICETVRHLFGTASGNWAGFAPAIDNNSAPIDLLTDAYNDIYRLKEYQPVFMQPTMFNLDSRQPVYYSLDYPNTIEFSPRSNEDKNKIQDLIYIKSMINQYLKTLNQSNLHVETTPIGQLDQHVNFNYIHTTQGYHAIEDVGIIMDNDPSFQILNQRDSRPLPLNSHFFRGCIQITAK